MLEVSCLKKQHAFKKNDEVIKSAFIKLKYLKKKNSVRVYIEETIYGSYLMLLLLVAIYIFFLFSLF